MPFLCGVKMKDIQECAKYYKTLMRKDYIFTLENGVVFKIFFKPSNFYHLIGLHKLKDVKQLTEHHNSLDNIYKDILSGRISVQTIENSVFYSQIKDRVEYFEKITDMLDKHKSKIIIDFDPKLIEGTELKNTEYILYRHLNSGYANLTIGKRNGNTYPETFFAEDSKRYISEQTLLDIVNIEVIDVGNGSRHTREGT